MDKTKTILSTAVIVVIAVTLGILAAALTQQELWGDCLTIVSFIVGSLLMTLTLMVAAYAALTCDSHVPSQR